MFTATGGPGAVLFREYQSLKYRGLKMIDIDVQDREKVGVVPMANSPGAKTPTLVAQKCRKSGKNITNMQGRDGYNWYLGCIVCYEDYDWSKSDEENDEKDYDIFELYGSDFYDCVIKYYEKYPDENLEIVVKPESEEDTNRAESRLPVDMVDRMMRGVKYVGKDNVLGDEEDRNGDEE